MTLKDFFLSSFLPFKLFPNWRPAASRWEAEKKSVLGRKVSSKLAKPVFECFSLGIITKRSFRYGNYLPYSNIAHIFPSLIALSKCPAVADISHSVLP